MDTLDEALKIDRKAFVFFQDKLGGEISIGGTPFPAFFPWLAGGIDVVELIAINADVSAERFQFMQPGRTEGIRFVLNAATLALANSRQRPLVRVQATQATSIHGLCTIAGQIIDAP